MPTLPNPRPSFSIQTKMARVQHRTFYDVLGISRDANHDAIKLAYKKMSRRCHPDKNPGNAHAVAWQQEVSSQSSSAIVQHIDEAGRRVG